jgi:hypothetical protein
MVWLYDRTGSLLVTTLMHGMLTASTIFWFTPIATGAVLLADVWLVAAGLWLLVALVAVADGWVISHRADRVRPATTFRAVTLRDPSSPPDARAQGRRRARSSPMSKRPWRWRSHRTD